jgi:hypothetical protein
MLEKGKGIHCKRLQVVEVVDSAREQRCQKELGDGEAKIGKRASRAEGFYFGEVDFSLRDRSPQWVGRVYLLFLHSNKSQNGLMPNIPKNKQALVSSTTEHQTTATVEVHPMRWDVG